MEHLDLNVLAELKEVMEDEFGTLVETYLADAIKRIEVIEVAIQEQNSEALRIAAHTFKGSCRNMAIGLLGDYCQALEQSVREGDFAEARQLLGKIKDEYQIVSDLLKAQVD